jgi:hypothetical protein
MNTAYDILARIAAHPNNPVTNLGLNYQARELEPVELKVNSGSARELSKRLKDKRDITRSCREPVETHQSPLAQRDELVGITRSEENCTTATTSVTEIERHTSSSSRVESDITGISVQHSKPTGKVKLKGIKLMVNVQFQHHIATHEVIKLTAELKRYERMYEVKAREGDSQYFNEYLKDTIQSIRDAEAKNYCLGRLHIRNKRSAWFADSFVVGVLDEQGVLVTVIVNLEGEEFLIDMNGPMSELQQRSYYSNGVFGIIHTGHAAAPRLRDAPTSRL